MAIGLGGFGDSFGPAFAAGANAFQGGQRNSIAYAQQQANERQQLFQDAQNSINNMVVQATELAKAVADQGGDPRQLAQNPSFQALQQGAMRTAQLTGGRIDPQTVAAQFQSVVLRPPVPEQKQLTTIPGGQIGEGQPVTFGPKTGTITPVQPPSSGSMLGGMAGTAPGETIGTPAQAPVPPVAKPVQVASAGTPAAQVASGFAALEPSVPGQPAPTVSTPPRFQPGSVPMADAVRLGLTGEEFLQATVPPDKQNIVRDVADYKVPLNSFSSRAYKGGESQRQIIYNLVSQYTNHQYDEKYYGAMKAAIKEFTSGGTQSPAGQITFGNTAIQHLGELSDSLAAIQSIPGLMSKIADSGIPLASYAARAVRNTVIRGTPEGRALAEFLDARNRYVEEITKFYAGSQGAEADRSRSLAVVDPNLSANEMNGVINKEATLMSSKVNALQARWKTALAGPRFSDALFRNAIPDFPIMQDKTNEAITKIVVRARPENGALPAGGAGLPPPPPGFTIQ